MVCRKSSKPLFCTRTYIALLCASALLSACEAPQPIERTNVYSKTNGASYTVDIIMLSEWAGRILPEKTLKAQTINLKNNHPYVNDINVDNYVEVANSNLYFYPKGKKNKNKKYKCSAEGNSGNYLCEIFLSGASAIEETWNDISSSKKKIYIGDGDSFGVSLPVTAAYQDYPTIHMMNMLGFTAETFGNQNFNYSLDDIQSLIPYANYPFVVSNFANLPNNLEGTTPYSIVDVPDDDGKNEPLHLAIVGAFDRTALDIITKGQLSTLAIDNYCPIIQSMEEAYNKNARAFVIISHVFTDKNSIKQFFNVLFSLDKNFASALNKKKTKLEKSDENNELFLIEDYPCASRLIITQAMLDDYRKTTDNSNATVNDLRKEIHQQIFDNILMVFGESNDRPFLTPIYAGNADTTVSACPTTDQLDLLDYGINGCITSIDNNNNNSLAITDSSILNLFYSSSIFEFDNSTLNVFANRLKITPYPNANTESLENATVLKEFGFVDIDYKIENKYDKHPIWFTELSPKGVETASATFKITKKQKADQPLKSSVPFYESNLTYYSRKPVFGTPYNTENTSNDINEAYNETTCNKLINTLKNTNLKVCKEYYDTYKDYLKGNKTDIPDYQECIEKLSAYETKNIKTAEQLWACLYYVTQWKYENDEFKNATICEFDHIIEGENKENEVRKYSTFIANFVTDLVLKYDYKAAEKIDGVFFNAGTTRESKYFKAIDSDFFNTVLPYPSTLFYAKFSINNLVKFLEYGLYEQTASGAFPAIAGIKFSYYNPSEIAGFAHVDYIVDKNEIQEIWKVTEGECDEDERFTKYDKRENICYHLKYLSETRKTECAKTSTNSTCILGAKSGSQCLIGDIKKTKSFDVDEFIEYEKEQDNLVIITNDYISANGDGYPSLDNNSFVALNLSLIELIKDILEAENNTGFCALKTDKLDSRFRNLDINYDVNYLITHNLPKRIFNENNVKMPGYDEDLSNQLCVATQSSLYCTFNGSDNFDYCDADCPPPSSNNNTSQTPDNKDDNNPPENDDNNPPENDGENPPENDGENPPENDGENPPENDGENPPENDGENPPENDGENPPENDGENPPENDGENPPEESDDD